MVAGCISQLVSMKISVMWAMRDNIRQLGGCKFSLKYLASLMLKDNMQLVLYKCHDVAESRRTGDKNKLLDVASCSCKNRRRATIYWPYATGLARVGLDVQLIFSIG